MRPSRLVLPAVVVGLVVPLAVSATAGRPAGPTFVQYTSPVGVQLTTGAPEPVAGVILVQSTGRGLFRKFD